ncbi:LANO_0A05314g1_1 [Lachancea nothofagi CBS 11611]|uniref:LANO_0A05314g1_1 n=1 Tax=Lachancea nothofagi CBS 11611 TaxID=1266666 RepID=A0A1G4IRG0_9SACH|nr:LANO_0A05314g1_1 [Lachancea nothofagi CBS 11611]
MDTLEEKRKKLQELRERRRQGQRPISDSSRDDLVNHLLNSNNNENLPQPLEMVNIATQTEETENLTKLESTNNDFPTLLTYERAVQTDPVEFKEPDEANQEANTETSFLDDTGEDSSFLEEGPISQVRNVVPHVVEDQSLTVGVKSFSLLEALDKTKASLTEKEIQNVQHFRISHILDPDSAVHGEMRCVWVDYYAELALVVLQETQTSQDQSSNSIVSVYKLSTAELVDTVVFRGQAFLRGQFIRRKRTAVTSALLTSYNGKTILYEIRAVPQSNGALGIERNLIVRNFHHYPVFAVWQHHTVDPRVLVGSTDGTVSELDILRMELYRDPASAQHTSHFKILPVSPSSLLLSEEFGAELRSGFQRQLDKQSAYDEVAITSMITMPQDPTVVYVGCEDGGIYKINHCELNSDSTVIDTNNNGFVPKINTENDEIFHALPITGLYNCDNAPNLMLSSAMDWECKVWDVVNNEKVATIELDYPVINCEWVSSQDAYFIFILTPTALSVFNPMVMPDYSQNGTVSWRAIKNPVEIFSISVDHCENFSYFTSVKVFEEKGKYYALLGGDSNKLVCMEVEVQT